MAEAVGIDRRALIRDAVRLSSLLGAGVCAVLAIVGFAELAIAVAIGTVLGAINLVLLARGVGGAIDRTVASVERARRAQGLGDDEGVAPDELVDRPRGAGGGLRLALVVALMVGILWWQPADPAGIAIGFILVLAGLSAAAVRHNRSLPRADERGG